MAVAEDQIALQATWQRLMDQAPERSRIEWLRDRTGESFPHGRLGAPNA